MSSYLTVFLPGIKGASYNTIASKRDTYILLLKYCDEVKHLKPEKVDIPILTADVIIGYLDWLESTRNVGISTRNIRLAACSHIFRHRRRIIFINASRYYPYREKRNLNIHWNTYP